MGWQVRTAVAGALGGGDRRHASFQNYLKDLGLSERVHAPKGGRTAEENVQRVRDAYLAAAAAKREGATQ